MRRKQDEAEEERRRQVEEIARQSEKPDGADRRSETGSIKSGRKCFFHFQTFFPPLFFFIDISLRFWEFATINIKNGGMA